MTPIVSVLMPALNEEHSIADAIEAVLQQRGVDLELLVILAASVDRTEQVVRTLAERDPRVHLLHNPRSIIPAALNLGLAAARGEFVARIDAHSRISSDYLARGIGWLQRNPKLASVGGLRRGVATTATGRAIALVLASPEALGDSINHFATEPRLTDHASFAVTRAHAAREVHGWDETLPVNEDVDFDHRLGMAGYQIGFDPAMEIFWRVQESLPRLFRQYRRYGRGKGQMIRKNGVGALRPRHLVPPAAVTGGVVLLTGGIFSRSLWLPLIPYAALVLWASAKAWRQRHPDEPTSPAALPAGFVAIHSAWGLGMIEGSLLNRQPARASGNSAVGEGASR